MKKAIQVTLDQELLDAIDTWAQEQGITRADFVRAACRRMVESPTKKQLEEWNRQSAESYAQFPEKWDPDEWKDYWPKKTGDDAEAYRRRPESTEIGDAQLAILKDILPDEEW